MLRIALKSKLEKDNINAMLRTALKSKLEKDHINAMLRAALITSYCSSIESAQRYIHYI